MYVTSFSLKHTKKNKPKNKKQINKKLKLAN